MTKTDLRSSISSGVSFKPLQHCHCRTVLSTTQGESKKPLSRWPSNPLQCLESLSTQTRNLANSVDIQQLEQHEI